MNHTVKCRGEAAPWRLVYRQVPGLTAASILRCGNSLPILLYVVWMGTHRLVKEPMSCCVKQSIGTLPARRRAQQKRAASSRSTALDPINDRTGYSEYGSSLVAA